MLLKTNTYYKFKHSHGKFYLTDQDKNKINILVDNKKDVVANYSNKIVVISKIIDGNNNALSDVYSICGETLFVSSEKMEIQFTDINGQKCIGFIQLEKDHLLPLKPSEMVGLVRVFNYYCQNCNDDGAKCKDCALKCIGDKISSIIFNLTNKA